MCAVSPAANDYYREKASEVCRTTAVDTPVTGTAENEVSSPSVSSKELRRARAQERAKRQPVVRALKERVAKAETRIAELEKELEQLSAVLFNPTPETDFSATNRRLKYVQDQLDAINEEWERDATELNRIQREQDEAQAAIAGPA